jgi:PST family polysaccharide transporter
MRSSAYRGILKTTSLIGVSSLISMLISMVRTKFVAILLGPSGVGLMGVYSNITGMVGTVFGMGIGTSGVRQIAEAHGAGDDDRLARTVKTLRRTFLLTGLLGMAAMVFGCILFSRASFGNDAHASRIAFLGLTILLGGLAGWQTCLLQGARRIGDMAKVGIVGSVCGAVIGIPCFYFWGQGGIVPSLILVSAASLATSWWYARRVPLKPVSMPWRESRADAASLLRFGVPFMLSGLASILTNYLVFALLVKQIGLEGVGIWQSALNLSGVLAGIVLNAIGADYYPRLTAAAADNARVCEEVNAQTEIILLLTVPGLAATIIFAPLAIALFYSGKFNAAVDVLRWSVYGVLGYVISNPLSYVVLAKGMGVTHLCMSAASGAFYVAAIWICSRLWGLPGTGIAFVLLHVFYAVVAYAVAHAVSRTTWTHSNLGHMIVFSILLALIGLISTRTENPWLRYSINLVLLVAVCVYCLRRLSVKSGITIRILLGKLGLSR